MIILKSESNVRAMLESGFSALNAPVGLNAKAHTPNFLILE